MRLKIRCDCTGEPPGELTVIATVGSFEALNAFSMAPATAARARPGRRGVTMPIGPVKRSTGTMGPRLKKRIGEPRVVRATWSFGDDRAGTSPNSRPGRPFPFRSLGGLGQRQGGAMAQHRFHLGLETVLWIVQDQPW